MLHLVGFFFMNCSMMHVMNCGMMHVMNCSMMHVMIREHQVTGTVLTLDLFFGNI
jgi:hypothetical protein